MKRVLIVLLAMILPICFSVTTMGWAAEGKATVLRLAGPYPPMDPVAVQLKAFADKFNEKAAGRYIIELHLSESLVKVMESMDAVRTGAVEMAIWPTGMFASVDKRFAAAEFPFLANNVEADADMQVSMMPLYNQFMEKKFNCKAVYSFTCLALDVCSTKSIQTAADWEKLMTQSVSPQSAKFIDCMKGAAVPMPWPEGYQALQKGVVNATMQSSSMMIMFKLYEVAKYVTRGYLIPASLMVTINMDVYNKMPKDLQAMMVEVGMLQQKETNDFWIQVDKDNNKTLLEKGVTVYQLPKEERERWAQQVKPYCDDLYKAMGPEFADQVKKISAASNAKFAY